MARLHMRTIGDILEARNDPLINLLLKSWKSQKEELAALQDKIVLLKSQKEELNATEILEKQLREQEAFVTRLKRKIHELETLGHVL